MKPKRAVPSQHCALKQRIECLWSTVWCTVVAGGWLETETVVGWAWVVCRPHDRVTIREMKQDWQSCLDSPVGFKVRPWHTHSTFLTASLLLL